MAGGRSSFPVTRFDGLKLNVESDEVGAVAAIDMLNVELDKRGAVRSRDGYLKLTAAAGATRYDSIVSLSGATTSLVSSKKVAVTVADDATVGTVTWTNPANAAASDNVYATAVLGAGAVSHYLKATAFGFAIPAGATINGIGAVVEGQATASGVGVSTVKLVKAGVIVGTNQGGVGSLRSGVDSESPFAGSTSLWGTTWTATDINSATFGLVVSVTATAAATASIDSLNITVYYTPTSTPYVLAGASGSRLDAIQADGSVVTTVATATDTQSTYAAFGSPATSAVYIANSGTTIRKYASAAFSTPATMPKAKYVAVQSPDNRLVAANIGTIPTGAGSTASTSLVHFSDAGSPEVWSANNYVYVTPGDNEDITGVTAWGNLVFVFKATKFFVFYGNNTDSSGNPVFNYRPITAGAGLVAPLATAGGKDGLYFLDRRGIYVTTGGPPRRLSSAIDPLFLGGGTPFYLAGTVNPAALSAASMTWFNDRLYIALALGSSTTNSHTLVYDPETDQWTIWNIPIGAMAPVGAQPGRLAFTYASGTNDIGLYAPNAYTDDAGTAISSWYRSGFYTVGNDPSSEATVTQTIIDGVGTPSFSLSRDFSQALPTSAGGAITAVTLGTSPAYAQGRHTKAQRGRRFSYQIEGTSAWTVESLTHHVRGLREPGLKTV